ncbi:PP2C family protein-serine/threonine phosphatase [Parafilimonas terrae]|uniref:Serine/threonine protein phosphatase PrpC n=1 Tax=Parafilimonas terrae TaxID=1465490 RepID=A0A1I5YA12_9BACT|nr:protein phosphatase 2C domain-containing protein [Parafilimonas terrae]SFQ41028.1 Serine/threonine protein phosphatase PrpC [Parafilimonas terrae]
MADNFYGNTDTGKMRDNNEDNFIAQKIVHDKYIVGCVIDGVGGYEGGEIAAALTRATILNTLKNASGDVIHLLKAALTEANKKIFEKKQKSDKHNQMACVVTLALVDINDNKFYYAHIGDTRLYLFRDNSLVKVTHDHSFVGFLEESGRLTEEAAMSHPKRNEINKALGFDEVKFSEPDYIDTGESPFLPGDTLLLCSDGLYDMINSRTITGILSSPQTLKQKSAALIDAANLAGGKDNITVVLIQNDKSPSQYEATKPVAKKVEPEQEIATAVPVEYIKKEIVVKKNGGAFIRFLVVLCLLLIAVLSWFIYKDYVGNNSASVVMPDPPRMERNSQVVKLSDSIKNSTSNIISLRNLFGNNPKVVINDSLLIKSDTLIIHGNNALLVADSSYNDAAFIFFPQCKYVLLDSITFENFNTAFIARGTAVHLKDVRFKNCVVPIAYAVSLPADTRVSGVISDSALLKIDSAKTIVHER